MALSNMEIEKNGSSIRLRKQNTDGSWTPWTSHNTASIRSVVPNYEEGFSELNANTNRPKNLYPYVDKMEIVFTFTSDTGTKEVFDIQQITNQPTWTPNVLGFATALVDINTWISGGLATETTLQAVLAAIDTMRDYEVRLVVDSDTPPVTWLEVRYWDAQDGTLGAPQYYLPGSTTPGTPVGSISYINQQTLLNQILAELEVIADSIHLEVDDDAIAVEQQLPTNINLLYGAYEGEGTEWERVQTDGDGQLKGIETLKNTLTSINNKLNTLGQKASAASTPVVLSTEQEALLNAIKTAVENIDIDLGTGGLNLEATQLLVKAVLDTIKTDTALINSNVVLGNITLNTIDTVLDNIKLDTASLDVALSTRSTEATLLLVKGVLDTIKTDTAAIDANTDGLETLLTTIDAVLDTIKLDTAKLDVNLSTRATEATLLLVLTELQGINLDTNGLNQEATQLLVKGVLDTIDAVLDAIKLDTAAMVTDLAAIETELLDQGTVLDTIDADTGNIATSTAAIDTKLAPAVRTHNTVSATGAGSVPAGSLCGSVINSGNAAGTWNGISLPAGISIPWAQIANRDTYGVINYDATGTTFIIEYTT